MIDQLPLRVEQVNGLFDRGQDVVVPSDHLSVAYNLIYTQLGFKTRFGFDLEFTKAGIVRIHVLKTSSLTADRVLIMTYSAFGNQTDIFDSVDLTTAIFSASGNGVDFSVLNFNDRAYFSFHNRSNGEFNGFLYVYDPPTSTAGTARKAAGVKPTSAVTATVSATAGNVELGLHLIAVVYETDTGFITQPNAVYTQHTTTVANRKIDLTNIPTGPAGTAKRHILASPIVVGGAVTAPLDTYELFFVPGGTIANNTATTLTINFYDVELVESADYLLNQLEEIPAFLGMANYDGNMIGWGESSSALSKTGDSILRVSLNGEPESFNDTDGFIEAIPSDGGRVKCCKSFRGILYIAKDHRFFASQRNDEAPNTWSVIAVDSGIGTISVWGIGAVLDSTGDHLDALLIADQAGLLLFGGAFGNEPLTWKIQDYWDRQVTAANMPTMQVLVNSVEKLIYIYGDFADSNQEILVGDFKNGLDPTAIRWSVWTFPVNVNAGIIMSVDPYTSRPKLKFASDAGNVYSQDPTGLEDFGNAINCRATLAYLTASDQNNVCHFAGYRAILSGDATVLVNSVHAGITTALASAVLASTTPVTLTRPMNIDTERLALNFSVNVISRWFELTCPLILFASEKGGKPYA